MNDFVSIEGLEVSAVIGIFDWEQTIQQPLVIDLEMAWDNRIPAASGDIADALDYDAVQRQVAEWITAKPWGLIEEVAEMLASQILAQFAVASIRVKVAKPTAVKAARTVAVTITRKQTNR